MSYYGKEVTQEVLTTLNMPPFFREWAGGQLSLQHVWGWCPDPTWRIWLASAVGVLDCTIGQAVYSVLNSAVQTYGPHNIEEVDQALHFGRRWLEGRTTDHEVSTATSRLRARATNPVFFADLQPVADAVIAWGQYLMSDPGPAQLLVLALRGVESVGSYTEQPKGPEYSDMIRQVITWPVLLQAMASCPKLQQTSMFRP